MRIMTIGAGNLSFAYRHMRRTEDLRASIFVALEAGFRLPHCLQAGLAGHVSHHRVAFGAGYTSGFMRTAIPVGAVAALVAAETNRVVVHDPAAWVILSERDDPAHAAAITGLERPDKGGPASGRYAFCADGLRGTQAGIVARNVIDRTVVKKRHQPVADHDGLSTGRRSLRARRLRWSKAGE